MHKDLPVIKIVSQEEEMHVKMKLEMDDSTHEFLVEWGKEEASDEDYINVAIRNGLLDAVKQLHEGEEKVQEIEGEKSD